MGPLQDVFGLRDQKEVTGTEIWGLEGCSITEVGVWAKNRRVNMAVCAGALSWWRLQLLLAHSSSLFLEISSR